MKTILLNCSTNSKNDNSSERFNKILSALHDTGIEGSQHRIQNQMQLLQILNSEKPDLIFSAAYFMKGLNDETVNIHRFLESQGIPYVGSDANTLELVLAKSELKSKWRNRGINTPDYVLAERYGTDIRNLMMIDGANGFPYILKEHCKQRIEYTPVRMDGVTISPGAYSIPITVGGATVFALDIEQYEEI